jgi:hypothetical protein
MPITAAQLQQIDMILSTAALDGATLAKLRQLGAGLTATRCDMADLADEAPFRSYARCALYLLDGRDHCMRITNDPGDATGLVVVAKG